uniref:Ribonuclease H-like domain-containing protein n=1 Tax=Tanacetum cinerariifolium TaxID=118510 RepID=A0A6L2MSE2_TANCI|nr:ribonuclease H-like domain-containing protein [Tanacetum cinerariifolium]
MVFEDKNSLNFFNCDEKEFRSSEPYDDRRDKDPEISEGTDHISSEDSQSEVNLIRSSRKTSMPKKFSDFKVDSKVKYSIDKHVNYSNLSVENFNFSTSLNKIIEPKTFDEATKDIRRIEAMNLEIEALNRNGAWIITELLVGRKSIGNKWVWKVKYKSAGEVERFKASLEEDVYMSLPEAYFSKDDKRAFKLIKFLYGLKQAPRKWNEKLTYVLLEHGFEKSKKEILFRVVNRVCTSLLVSLHYDNSSAIQIAANHVFHDRTKHFEIELFFLREKVASGLLKLINLRGNIKNVNPNLVQRTEGESKLKSKG